VGQDGTEGCPGELWPNDLPLLSGVQARSIPGAQPNNLPNNLNEAKVTRRRIKPSIFSAPLFLAPKMMELTLASWETITRRTMMIASGTCSPAEYRRMVQEKSDAIRRTALLLAGPRRPSAAALMKPWHAKATANARRLRRK